MTIRPSKLHAHVRRTATPMLRGGGPFQLSKRGKKCRKVFLPKFGKTPHCNRNKYRGGNKVPEQKEAAE